LAAALGVLVALPLLPARSIAAVELNVLDQVSAPTALLFAGFPGCATVCPTTLSVMDRARDLASAQTALVFINIQRDAHPGAVRRYVEQFAPDVVTASIDDRSAKPLMRALGIRGFDSQRAASTHRGDIYVLVQREQRWQVADVLHTTPSPEMLAALVDASNESGPAEVW
ncbi:MAG: SCO family protein, partial [Pseudomonadota bacterium]